MTSKKFYQQIEGTKFQQDLENLISVNNGQMEMGVWNLILSIRDVSLFSKGIKPHRMWRLKDVKWYFGVTGGTDKVLEQLKQYKEVIEKIREEQRVAQLN
jgi:hypothetical protein